MGYYDILNIFENDNWRERCRLYGGELVMEAGEYLTCPRCLFPFERARLVSGKRIICPHCEKTIDLED